MLTAAERAQILVDAYADAPYMGEQDRWYANHLQRLDTDLHALHALAADLARLLQGYVEFEREGGYATEYGSPPACVQCARTQRYLPSKTLCRHHAAAQLLRTYQAALQAPQEEV